VSFWFGVWADCRLQPVVTQAAAPKDGRAMPSDDGVLRSFGLLERRQYLFNAFRSWSQYVASQHAEAYVDHIIGCLLARFARARRSRSLFTTMEVFKDGIVRAYEQRYSDNLVFLQLNRSARNVKRSHLQAWSSVLDMVSDYGSTVPSNSSTHYSFAV
jgi:hypothetical protein